MIKTRQIAIVQGDHAQHGVGLTVFEPGNIEKLIDFRRTSTVEIVIIGLDTVKDCAEQSGRVGGVASRCQTQAEIDAHRAIIVEHSDLMLTGDLNQNVAAIVAAARLLRSRGGVIDGQTVRAFTSAGALLQEYKHDYIQTASYDLRLSSRLKFGVTGGIEARKYGGVL